MYTDRALIERTYLLFATGLIPEKSKLEFHLEDSWWHENPLHLQLEFFIKGKGMNFMLIQAAKCRLQFIAFFW